LERQGGDVASTTKPVPPPRPGQLHGFSDLDDGRAWFEKLPPGGLKGSTNSFNVGDFDLYTNTQLSDSWSMLGEKLVSSDFSNEFSVEMDRLLLTLKEETTLNARPH